METNGTRKKKKSSRFRGNGSTQHRLLQRFNYYASRRVREFYRPQERRKSANTSPGMNLTGGVRFDLFVPTRVTTYLFSLYLLPPLKQRGWDWEEGWERRYSKNWNIERSLIQIVLSFPSRIAAVCARCYATAQQGGRTSFR